MATPEDLYLYKCGPPEVSWDAVARRFGLVSGEAARNRVARWRRKRKDQRPDRDKVGSTSFKQDGPNRAYANSLSTRIRTLDQLVDACGVDLEIWEVGNDWGAKVWEGYAKFERTDLTYDEGKATGTIEKGGLETEPLWSVWAKFIRRNPIPKWPAVQSIECRVSYKKPSAPSGRGIQRTLVICDPHTWYHRDMQTAQLTPFHDRRVLDLALQIAVAAGVDRVAFLGDLVDMSDWTDKFLRLPEWRNCAQPALLEFHWWLRQFRVAVPEARITLFEGNHDARMRYALLKNLEGAYELRAVDEMGLPPTMSLPKLLALHQLSVEWIGNYPDELERLNQELCLCHGDIALATSQATAKKMAEKYNAKVIFGHIHRREWATITKHLRDQFASAVCPGCACHIDGRIPGHKKSDQWQQGFAVVDYEVEGTQCGISLVEIENGQAIWNGKLFVARDRTGDLHKDIPGWNW